MLASKPKTKLLVDGGDPEDTSRVKKLLGFVDGQTTNPSRIENPDIQRRIASGHTLSAREEERRVQEDCSGHLPVVRRRRRVDRGLCRDLHNCGRYARAM